ncbi:MAG: PAS domain S-box protein [Woeseiaceae bacterium]|nr:PAS domain S-box protein [Woeseiaceae bacterium]
MKLSRSATEKLLTSATDAIVVVDGKGDIAFANPRAEEMFGYARGELVGERVEVLLPEHLRGRHR